MAITEEIALKIGIMFLTYIILTISLISAGKKSIRLSHYHSEIDFPFPWDPHYFCPECKTELDFWKNNDCPKCGRKIYDKNKKKQ